MAEKRDCAGVYYQGGLGYGWYVGDVAHDSSPEYWHSETEARADLERNLPHYREADGRNYLVLDGVSRESA